MDAVHLFWFWAMPSTRSDGMASGFSGTPESVVALPWNQWTAYPKLVDEFFGIRTGRGGQVQVRHGCRLGVRQCHPRAGGRELVWLDVHEDPVVFSRETVLSPSNDPVSRLWNHNTGQFRAWDRPPQPPKHFLSMLPAEFTGEQYAEARRRVRTYNRSIARAIQTDDEKALVSAIQELEGWSVGVTENRRTWAQAVWHAAHETERLGATASAAFCAFRPGLLAQLHRPQPRPMSEIVILGAQHENNLGDRVVEYEQPRTVRLQVLVEDYTDTYGCTERRIAAYELDRAGTPARRIGYLPKDAPRRMGEYLATLHRPGGKKRLEGKLSALKEYTGKESTAP